MKKTPLAKFTAISLAIVGLVALILDKPAIAAVFLLMATLYYSPYGPE
jgi:hypothetical protein